MILAIVSTVRFFVGFFCGKNLAGLKGDREFSADPQGRVNI